MEIADLKVNFLAGDLGQGGAERQLYYILKTLKSFGARVKLISLTSGEYWEERIRKLGVEVEWAGKMKSRLARLMRIAQILKRDSPQIFQSQHFYTNCYVSLLSRLMSINDIAAMRNNGAHEVRANGSVLGKMNLRLPRIIAANSKEAIRYAEKAGVSAKKLFYLPNVVDTSEFEPGRDSAEHAVRLLAVGRLVRQKRFDRFLNLVNEVNKHANVPVRATLVGGGTAEQNLKPQLEQQAAEMGLLPDVVTFKDPVASMREMYAAADIFVMTSDFEGTPNVLLEAMASGLPVVATAVGDVSEIVRSGYNGFTADPGDQKSLADALRALVNSRQMREDIGNRARRYIELNRSEKALPSFLKKLYQLTLS